MPEGEPATGDQQQTATGGQGDQQPAGGTQSQAAATNQDGDQQQTATGGQGDQQPATGEDWSATIDQLKADGLTPGQVNERLKASRKWEQRAKENANAKKELDELKKQSMSDQEKAVEQARQEAAQTVRSEMGRELAESKFRSLANGRLADVDAALEFVDLSKFLGEDGRPDVDAINGAVERLTKLAPAASGNTGESAAPQPAADLKQGSRGGSPPPDPNAWLRRAAGRQ